LLAARGWREPVGQVADECLNRFLRDEEGAATFPTRDVSPVSDARAKLAAQNDREPDQPVSTSDGWWGV
jgi:hypothetical protein